MTADKSPPILIYNNIYKLLDMLENVTHQCWITQIGTLKLLHFTPNSDHLKSHLKQARMHIYKKKRAEYLPVNKNVWVCVRTFSLCLDELMDVAIKAMR